MKTRLFLALVLLSGPLAGQTAYMVEDLVTGQGGRAFFQPRSFLTVGSRVFFIAESGSGSEVYATDGSSAGTRLLADVCPGGCGSDPVFRSSAGDVLFFSAEPVDRESITELWRSDGTRKGTFPLIRGIRESVVAGGSLFFSVCERVGFDCDLWKTNGTGNEAVLVKDLNPQPFDGNRPERLTAIGDRVVFMANGPARDPALWVSDGTDAGTSLVHDFGGDVFSLEEFAVAGGKAFFVAHGLEEELWATDGTAAGTVRLTHFENPDPFQRLRPQALGGELFFLADDVTHGQEIWRSDGTPQGTRRATGIGYHEPFGSSDPLVVERLGSRLVFLATDGIRSRRLWTLAGTPESAAPLDEGCPGGCPEAAVGPLIRVGNRLLFWGTDAGHGFELWSTDGTPGSTLRLADICPGPCGSLEYGTIPVALLGAAFFVAGEEDFFNGKASLWRSDGTPAGTKRFAGPDPSVAAQIPAALGQKVVFAARTEDYGTEPWTSDGTPGGTGLIANLMPDSLFSRFEDFAALGSQVLFSLESEFCERLWRSMGIPGDPAPLTDCQDDVYGLTPSGSLVYFWLDPTFDDPQVWATDGTLGGTRPVSPEFNTARGPFPLVPFNGRVYLLTDPSFSLPEIWRIDAGGAAKLDLLPEVGTPFQLGSVADRLYFVTQHQELGLRLWTSDGLSSWTPLVPPGFIWWSLPRVRVGNHDYFTRQGQGSGDGASLWKTDGTPAGTIPVLEEGFERDDFGPSSMTGHQGSLFFFARAKGSVEWSLWKSDGTGAGTQPLRTFTQPFDEPPPGSVSFGPYLYFAANDQVHGRELWRTDGTPEGTVLVRDFHPGEPGSRIGKLKVAGGKLFFTAHDGIHGEELWQTDGTEAGTRLVHDINPLSESSYPAELNAAGDRLFFVADDGLAGRELWALPLASGSAGCHPSATALCLSQGRFKVEASWRDFQGNTGTGKAVPLTADTGYFWFFGAANVEVMVKVLNGQGLNSHHWVFYGALSSVEYTLTVTDTQTGLTRHYFNPMNQLASVGDTTGFGPLGAFSRTPPAPAVRSVAPATGICEPSATRLCLQGGRFAVEAEWKDFTGKTGKGQAVGLTGDTGYLWFFDAANVEVVIKVLDGRGLNGRFWVFYGALSSVEYSLKVTDTQTGEVRTYRNPSGRMASSADVDAF